jgi:hypothetical protein
MVGCKPAWLALFVILLWPASQLLARHDGRARADAGPEPLSGSE